MLTLLVALTAHADVPPPPGYVESCTVANHASDTVECVECEGYHGGRAPCEALEEAGYTKECQTRGASVWTEVMCRAKGEGDEPSPIAEPEPAPEPEPEPEPEPKPTPEPTSDPEERRRCSLVGGSASAWLLLPLLAVRRR